MTTNQSVAQQILTQTLGQTTRSVNYPIPVSSDDLMKRITELQEAGYVTNAKLTNVQAGRLESTLVMEVTAAGVRNFVMRKIEAELLDTDFLEDQIAEYQDQVPKAFLEGLKAAEGILRGTDFLENYIETK